MNPRPLTLLVVLFAFIAAPFGSAFAWSSGGGVQEPSTHYDTSTYMWQTSNPSSTDKIYFNGFLVDSDVGHDFNPVEGSNMVMHLYQAAAYLGFWRDCNRDGYIGAKTIPADYALSYGDWAGGQYPAAVTTVDTAVCPAGSLYNQDTYIDEFRWIGPNATENSPGEYPGDPNRACDPLVPTTLIADCLRGVQYADWKDYFDVDDDDAVVWVDYSRPDATTGMTTPLLPNEMFDNSSNTLHIVDFYDIPGDVEETTLGVVPASEVWDTKPSIGDCGPGVRPRDGEFLGGPELVPGTGVGTCGAYPLWQATRLLNDTDNANQEPEPVVWVFTYEDEDGTGSPCDDTQLAAGRSVPTVDPGVQEDPLMDGSVGGTIWSNVLYALGSGAAPAMDESCREEAHFPPDDPLYAGTSSANGKKTPDTFLEFNNDIRFRHLRKYGQDNVPFAAAGLTSHPSALSHKVGWFGFNPVIKTFATDQLEAPMWTTFYGYVSSQTFQDRTSATAATALPGKTLNLEQYGARMCPDTNFDEGPVRDPNTGWICDLPTWEEERSNFNADQGYERMKVTLGSWYNVRDVDCIDDTPAKGLHTGEINVEFPAETHPVLDTLGAEHNRYLRTTCAPDTPGLYQEVTGQVPAARAELAALQQLAEGPLAGEE